MKLSSCSLQEGYNPYREWSDRGVQFVINFEDDVTLAPYKAILDLDYTMTSQEVLDAVLRFAEQIKKGIE